MKNKLFTYGISIGLVVSIFGLVLLKTNIVANEYYKPIQILYKITTILALAFLLIKSTFVRQNFHFILKVIGGIFITILGINLLSEFNIYEVTSVKVIAYMLLCSLPVLYTLHFCKKKNKTQLDYLKVGFLLLLFIGGFLKMINFFPNNLKYISGTLFWFVILGMLFFEKNKTQHII